MQWWLSQNAWIWIQLCNLVAGDRWEVIYPDLLIEKKDNNISSQECFEDKIIMCDECRTVSALS